MQVFVLGTGRSGTHWVGNILSEHPAIRATIEDNRAFRVATQAAIQPSRRPRLLRILRALYLAEIVRSKPLHYADKSHPVIWFADEVARWFPNARFVGVERSPYGTVASMLRHGGVRARQENWTSYELPNPFLGIDQDSLEEYGSFSPAERAALRWRSHHQQMRAMKEALGDRMLVLEYEEMVDAYERKFAQLWQFVGLDQPALSHRPKVSSRDAWRVQLAEADIEAIHRITGLRM